MLIPTITQFFFNKSSARILQTRSSGREFSISEISPFRHLGLAGIPGGGLGAPGKVPAVNIPFAIRNLDSGFRTSLFS
jgi:hypothetical protein